LIRSTVLCSVLCILLAATIAASDQHTYQKGTITGWNIRVDSNTSGGTGNSPVSTINRRAKVYELKGSGLVYKVDYCGAFQAGKFDIGQTVDYRVDGDRLYIRRAADKEYKCKIEGTKAADGAKLDAPSATR
jgi:hypothetical protein